MRGLRDEQGMVLLLVLFVVALLSSLLTEFAFSTLVDLRLTETFRDSTRAYYLAKGGVKAGRILLQMDRNNYDIANDPNELWSVGIPSYPVGEDGFVSVKIQDLGGKLPINRLYTTFGPSAVYMKRFENLFGELGLNDPDKLTRALVDWIDSHSKKDQFGAVTQLYTLASLDELNLVPGFSAEDVRTVKPYLTVYGGKKLNVNTASLQVMLAWDPVQSSDQLSQQQAQAIVSARSSTPFKSYKDLQNLLGINTLSAFNRNNDVAFTSATFRIESHGQVNDGSRMIVAVVEKGGDKLLYLKVL